MWHQFHQCKRFATVERDGKSYCAQHDPEAEKLRRQKTSELWDRRFEQQRRAHECVVACEGMENPIEEIKRLKSLDKPKG